MNRSAGRYSLHFGPAGGGGSVAGGAASVRYGRQHMRGPAGGHGVSVGGDGGRFAAGPVGPSGTYRPAHQVSAADLDPRVINTIAGEVSTKNPAGVDAVINNMMNRVGSKGWGPSKNLLDVARAPGQYAGYRQASAAETAYIRSRITAIASGGVEDNTHGSNAYRAASYHGPWYRKHAADAVIIGGNRFAFERGVANGPYAPFTTPHEAVAGGDQQFMADPARRRELARLKDRTTAPASPNSPRFADPASMKPRAGTPAADPAGGGAGRHGAQPALSVVQNFHGQHDPAETARFAMMETNRHIRRTQRAALHDVGGPIG